MKLKLMVQQMKFAYEFAVLADGQLTRFVATCRTMRVAMPDADMLDRGYWFVLN